MAKNVFILGAGASAHAGVPLMKDFYDEAINLYLKKQLDFEDLGSFELIENIYLNIIRKIYANFNFDPELRNVETIFSIIDMSRITGKIPGLNELPIKPIPDLSLLNLHINKFISRTIEKKTYFELSPLGTINSPEEYSSFTNRILKWITSNDILGCCIITFNYDIALDYVIEVTFGHEYLDYGFPDYGINTARPTGSTKLLKMHGSINWTRCRECNAVQAVNISDTCRITPSINRIEISKKFKEVKCAKCEKYALGPSSIIVPPTWNKTENIEIENIWKQSAQELSEAKNIFIIGYSFPKTDLFFQYLLALGTINIMNLERFWVFDKNSKIDDKYIGLLNYDIKRKYRFFKMPFIDAISILETEISNHGDQFY